MAPTILSRAAIRDAHPDLGADSVNLLVRERAILELAKAGISRKQAKRLVFLGWLIRRRDLEA